MGIGAKAITFLEKEFSQAKRWRLDTSYSPKCGFDTLIIVYEKVKR